MLNSFGLLGLFLIVAIVVCAAFVIIPKILRIVGLGYRHNPNPDKYTIYECGMVPVGRTHIQFNFRYYFFAVLFVAFDVLAIFLFPWAIGLRDVAWFGLGAAVLLVSFILVAYLYAWRKGVMQWK